MSVKDVIQHIIDLDKQIAQAKENGEDYTEALKERSELLDNPYVYDKYYGLGNGGII